MSIDVVGGGDGNFKRGGGKVNCCFGDSGGGEYK